MGKPFTPREVIFAPTARCNLSCGHCRVNRNRGAGETKLTAESATAFLESCASGGIDRVGFSGGEPFLEPDFLASVIARAVELGLYFDRLMTNGVWWETDGELKACLAKAFDAGFDGTIAISVDDWHGQDPERLARFIRAAADAAGRFDAFEIVSVLSRSGDASLDRLKALAKALDCDLVREGAAPIAIRNQAARKNRAAGMDDGSGIDIPILTIPYSSGAPEAGAWNAERWFTDDWCEGPGEVFYVHPDALVSVCCGFANERDELIVGTASEGYEELLAAARAKPHVRACYELGLGKYRERLEAAGTKFPGKTRDQCFFCDWLCQSGLTARE